MLALLTSGWYPLKTSGVEAISLLLDATTRAR